MGFRSPTSQETSCESFGVYPSLSNVPIADHARRMRFTRTMNAYTDDRPFSIDLAAAVGVPQQRPDETFSHSTSLGFETGHFYR